MRGEAARGLKATTIIEWLEGRHPGRFSLSQLRTLQRPPVLQPALQGPDREVYFPQEHPPGREAQIDFTHGNSLGVIIAGQPYHPPVLPVDPLPLGMALRGGNCR